MSIPVASDPVLPPPSRPEPNRPAARQADASFEQLLEAAAPSAEEARPPEAPKTSRKDSHGEDVREARSNRPESREEPGRTKGRDKAPPPEKQTETPTEAAPEGETAAAANEGAQGAPSDQAPTNQTPAGQAPTGQEMALTTGQETAGDEILPTGEDVTAILDGATPDTPALDAIAIAPPPVVAPQPEAVPVLAAAVAVTAPPQLAAATPDGPAVDPLTGGAPAAAVAAATTAAATTAAAETAPAETAKPVATADADAAPALAGLVTGETVAKSDKPAKAPVAAAAGNERLAQPAVDLAPDTDQAPARPAQEPAAPQQAAAKEAPQAAPALQDHGGAATKADAPASQATQTPNIPLPGMGPTALRVATNPATAVPMSGLAVEIVTRVQNGDKSFEIRLDPAELGRVDVRLDVDKAGNVTTRLTVERPETLDMLRRDSATLERALQQAGLKTEGGLEFNLRDQSQAHRDQSQRDQAGQQNRIVVPDEEPLAPEALRRGYGRILGLSSGVDIRV